MKIAVISAIYNEAILLPQFLDYYSPQVDTVFLLDNESTDESKFIAGRYPNVIVSIYSSGGQFSDVALSEAYDRKRRECVGQFDYVILADCDEFIIPKSCDSLAEAIRVESLGDSSGVGTSVLWTHGFNMWAQPQAPAYDPTTPLIFQRMTGLESHEYSKPCIIKPDCPLIHQHGRHEFIGGVEHKPASLGHARFYLLHYIGFDENTYVRRGLDRTSRFSQVNIAMGTSHQYRDKSVESYQSTFRKNSTDNALVKVPLDTNAVVRHLDRRRLDIGSGNAPTPWRDTLDWHPKLNSTYSFDLESPEWPISPGLYDEVLVNHALNHLPVSGVDSVLRKLVKCMKPGGNLRIHVPSGLLVAKACRDYPEERSTLVTALYGTEKKSGPAVDLKAKYDFLLLKSVLLGIGCVEVEDITEHYEDHHDARWAWIGGRVSLKGSARKPLP